MIKKLYFVLFFFTLIFFFQKLHSQDIDFLIVDKSLRELKLVNNGSVIKKYKISLGFEPIGKKVKRGDGKTPEGLYFIEEKLSKSSYFLALKISYPNPWDIRRALTLNMHPGGQIMIHGVPNEKYDKNFHHAENDWTEGCIAVTNRQMTSLWKYISVGTPILIRK